jgi:hypothetical protein
MTRLLTVDQFAEAIGWKPATVRQKVWRREIDFVRIGKSDPVQRGNSQAAH